jgi:hypothetical protein
MCEPELVLDFQTDIYLPYNLNYQNNLSNIKTQNIIDKENQYRLRTSHTKEVEQAYFDKEKCDTAYKIIMKYLNENIDNEGEERKKYVGRLFNFLIWMLDSQYSLMFKKDMRLRHLLSYANTRAEHFISELTSELNKNMNKNKYTTEPLLDILINYHQIWCLHSSNKSRFIK